MLQNTTSSKAKRKAPDDEVTTNHHNPLLAAAKKAKREAKGGASNKRKLLNTEEQPGGLLIVRAPPSSAPTPISTTVNANTNTNTKPPSKKFKSSQPNSNSQPLPSKPSSRSSLFPPASTRHDTPDADPALDDAVRAMQDEAAHLRRTSRGPTHALADDSHGLSQAFRFPTPAESQANGNGVAASKGKRRETIVDTSKPLAPEGDETPQIQRNKRLRAGAMAALGVGSSNDPSTPLRGGKSSGSGSGSSGSEHRRRSSMGRGKRISSSFQSTGIITQPHNSVSDASFFKHIDADLPDAERIRQLFIWCAARAAASPSTSAPLKDKPAQALKAGQEDLMRKLAERRVDLSMFVGDAEPEPEGAKRENSQNVTNRVWEGVYGGHIKSAIEEEENWKKVRYRYDTYTQRLRSSLEKRKAAISPPEDAAPTPSAKSQGKQRARTIDLEPREQELPQHFQEGMRLARTVLARSRRRPDPNVPSTPGAGPSTQKGVDPDSRVLTAAPSYDPDAAELELKLDKEAEQARAADAALRARMGEVELKLDHLYVLASQARVATEVGQLALDRRFEMLARALDARSDSTPKVEDDVLGQYVPTGTGSEPKADEAFQLLRALARVDATRPPGKVGDAARRAVREAQRVGESGAGDRRLTGVPPAGVGVTPRKMPGTPRRGTTPSRDRQR